MSKLVRTPTELAVAPGAAHLWAFRRPLSGRPSAINSYTALSRNRAAGNITGTASIRSAAHSISSYASAAPSRKRRNKGSFALHLPAPMGTAVPLYAPA